MTEATLKLLKVVYSATAMLLLAFSQFLCRSCSMEMRDTYLLIYIYGISLVWSCFFSEKIFVGWYPVDRSNKLLLYFVLVVGLFLISYSLYLLFVGRPH